MRILITGAEGQLGRSLPHALQGHELLSCNRARLDITEAARVGRLVDEFRPHFIINAAAWNHVDRAETEIHEAYQVNAVGPGILAQAAENIGAGIVHVSTDYVFDGDQKTPYLETDEPSPRSVYGASKLAGEEAVRSLNPRHLIIRTAWVFHEDGANFLNTMIRLAQAGDLRVVNDQMGSPTYAPHLAQSIARLMQADATGLRHVAGRGAVTWYGLTAALIERLELQVQLEPVDTATFPRPAHRPPYSVLGTSAMPSMDMPTWQEGLEEFCGRLQANQST